MVSIGMILILIFCSFYFGILYTNPQMVLLGYTCILLCVISVIELVYRFFTMRGFVDIPITMAEQGMPVNVRIRIRNTGFLPAGNVCVKLRTSNAFQTGGKSQWIELRDVGIGEQSQEIRLSFSGAGCHEVEIQKIRVHSLLGFGYIKKNCRDFASVLILPEVHFIPLRISEAVRNFMGDAEVYDEFRPGMDTGETFEIRAYRAKDKMQNIHWKISAKMDELMVKEYSLPKACAIVLFLNRKTGMKKKDVSAYLEVIASISFTLMDQKCPHYVVWYSKDIGDVRRIRVDDEESFYMFWDIYLRDSTVTEKVLREEYKQKYRNECYLHDLSFHETLDLYKDGEHICHLDGMKIQDACEKLEILL